MRTEKIIMLYEALSPLTHMMGTSGNESIINREPVMTNYGKRYIPVLSGNSIRHSMIREAGVNHLLKSAGIEELENIDQLNFLYTGGSLTESSVSESVEKIKQIYEKLPLIKLLGGSLRNQIITGMMLCGRGMMICEENKTRLEDLLPKEYLEEMPDMLMSAEIFVGNYQYTRGDVSKQKQGKIKVEKKDKLIDVPDEKKEKSNLMIYNGQTVISGALFVSEFILQDVNDIDIGAFFTAVSEWQEGKGTLGGYGRIGHGKVKVSLLTDHDVKGSMQKYESYMKAQGDIKEFLDYLFPEKEKKKSAKS